MWLRGPRPCNGDDVRVIELMADKRLADDTDDPKTIIHLELLEEDP